MRRFLSMIGCLAVLLPISSRVDASTPFDPAAAVRGLPASYAGWHVSLTPDSRIPQRLTLSFDSPVLHQRVSNVVWLPTSYGDHGPRRPGVLYYLHGTSFIDTGPAAPLLTAGHDANSAVYYDELTPFGGYFAGAHQFQTLLDRQHFVTVVLDTQQPVHWCGHCWWIDGRNGQGVQAETHLHKELIPLIQSLFDVRTDRGGRGVLGHSMGGTGALIQGFRHPDVFGFIGETGGTVPGKIWGPYWDTWVLWNDYYRSQGYGTVATDEIFYRNIDPLELAPQMSGENVALMMAFGDGCNLDDTTCQEEPPVGGGRLVADDGEADYRRWTEPASERLTELGVPHFFIKRVGTHVGEIYDTYSRQMVDRINRVFDNDVPDPVVVSYKTVDKAFSLWGYDVSVTRPNNEFLNLVGAHLDGSQFVLAGTGTAKVTTPAKFQPGQAYDVTVTREDATSTTSAMTADSAGRITLSLDLGPTRAFDERDALIDAGEFRIPQTLVEIRPPAR